MGVSAQARAVLAPAARPDSVGALHEGGDAKEVLRRQSRISKAQGGSLKKVGFCRLSGPPGDVWAHEGYAYVGSKSTGSPAGVQIVSLTNPRSPKRVARIATIARTTQEDVVVRRLNTPSFQGNLLAVGIQAQNAHSDAPRGVDLWDVTDPRRPRHLSFWSSGPFRQPTEARGVHELHLFQRGSRAFVLAMVPDAEEYEGVGQLRILEVTDPRNPVLLRAWGAFADGGFSSDPTRFPWGHSVTANAAGTLAVCSFWDAGAAFLDITDPANPRLVGRILYPAGSMGNTHSVAFGPGETTLLVADENLRPIQGPEPWGYLRVWDIHDLANPVQIARFVTPNAARVPARTSGSFCIHNATVKGDVAYLSWYSDGVRAVDISDPANPQELGFYRPKNAFIWGVATYEDLVLATDMNSGLQVMKLVR